MSRRIALVGTVVVAVLGATGVAVALAAAPDDARQDVAEPAATVAAPSPATTAPSTTVADATTTDSPTTSTTASSSTSTTEMSTATSTVSSTTVASTVPPPVSIAPVAGPAPDPATCPPTGRAAVVDREHQRAWLCEAGAIARLVPMTSARSQPDPGTYSVYAKDMNSSSNFTGAYSTMTHFVAFTYGKYQGARIAFHSVPKYADGSWVQPLESVGTEERFGESSGCLRVLPEDAQAIWDWLSIGDPVVVVT